MVEALIFIFLDESTWRVSHGLITIDCHKARSSNRYCVIGSSVRTTEAYLPKAVERNRFLILTQSKLTA